VSRPPPGLELIKPGGKKREGKEGSPKKRGQARAERGFGRRSWREPSITFKETREIEQRKEHERSAITELILRILKELKAETKGPDGKTRMHCLPSGRQKRERYCEIKKGPRHHVRM